MTPGDPTAYRPPAGWHRDNADPTLERWWDGYRWTDATRPAYIPTAAQYPAAQYPAAHPAAGYPAVPPPGRSTTRNFGRVSLVLGIVAMLLAVLAWLAGILNFGIVGPLALLGVILGGVALVGRKSDDTSRDRAIAIAGSVLSGTAGLLAIVQLAVLIADVS